MLTAYQLRDGLLRGRDVEEESELPRNALWIDLLRPSAEERAWMEHAFGEELPTEQSAAEIEASSRCYQEDGATHVRSYVLRQGEGETSRTATMAFIISGGRLVTVRPADRSTFAPSSARQRPPGTS